MPRAELEVGAQLLAQILGLPPGTCDITGASFQFRGGCNAVVLQVAGPKVPQAQEVAGISAAHECDGQRWYRTELVPVKWLR